MSYSWGWSTHTNAMTAVLLLTRRTKVDTELVWYWCRKSDGRKQCSNYKTSVCSKSSPVLSIVDGECEADDGEDGTGPWSQTGDGHCPDCIWNVLRTSSIWRRFRSWGIEGRVNMGTTLHNTCSSKVPRRISTTHAAAKYKRVYSRYMTSSMYMSAVCWWKECRCTV